MLAKLDDFFGGVDLKDLAERAITAGVIAAIVAYEAGARDYKVLAGAALGAALSLVKNGLGKPTVAAVKKPAA